MFSHERIALFSANGAHLDACLLVIADRRADEKVSIWAAKKLPCQIILILNLIALNFNGISIVNFFEIQDDGERYLMRVKIED